MRTTTDACVSLLQIMFNFANKKARSKVRAWIKRKCALEYRDRDHHRMAFKSMLHDLQVRIQPRAT